MMGLNTTQLEIVIAGDDEILSHAAGVILLVREEGNLFDVHIVDGECSS